MSVASKALRSAAWTSLFSYLSVGISFLGNIVLARLLLPNDFGVYVLASSLLIFIFMIAGFGSQEAIVQCHDETLSELIPTAMWMTIILALVLAAIGSFFGIALAVYHDATVGKLVILFSWMRVLTNIGYAYRAILERLMRFKLIVLIDIVALAVSFFAAIIAASLNWGVWALAIREAIFFILVLLGLGLASQYRLQVTFNRTTALWIWDFGWRIMISRISDVIFGRLDNLLIGFFLGTSALGHYSIAYRLALLGQQLTEGAVRAVAFSTYAEVQKETIKLKDAFKRVQFWLIRICLPLGLVVAFCGNDLVLLVYGDKWGPAGQAFQMMFLLLAWLPLHESLKNFLEASGHVSEVVKARVWQLLFFVPAATTAVYLGNLGAVVVAVTASLLLSWLIMYGYVKKLALADWTYLMLNPLLACLLGALTTSLAVYSTFQTTLLLGLFLKGSLTAIIYLVVLWLLEGQNVKLEWTSIRARWGSR